jgi:primosomal replication protein N
VSCNRTLLCGRLETRGVLRFSPAGVALVDFTIAHRSEQKEANTVRKVDCVMKATAAEDLAQKIAKLPVGAQIKASGFLAQASRANSALVLHVQNFELIE